MGLRSSPVVMDCDSTDALGSSVAASHGFSETRPRKGRRGNRDRQLATITDESRVDGCEHIQCLIERLSDDLTAQQRARAEEFIRSRSQVFSRSEIDIGWTDVLQHRIDTGDQDRHSDRIKNNQTIQ